MTRRPARILLLLLVFLTIPFATLAEDVEEFTQRITEELRATDPEAAELFIQANAARDREEFLLADSLYSAVNTHQPSFFHALRRRSWAQLMMGHRRMAVDLARKAYSIEETRNNLSMLVMALADRGEESQPTVAELNEAQGLAYRLLRFDDADEGDLTIVCQVGIVSQETDLLRRGVDRFKSLAPESPEADFFGWFLAMMEGRHDEAAQALNSAREHGLPEKQLDFMVEAMRDHEPFYARWLKPATTVGAIWIAGLLLLLLLGHILSRAALRAAGRLHVVRSGEATGLDAKLRSAYRIVLWLCCAYYYISIPLVLATVLIAGGGLLYGFLTLGRIPIKLVLLVGGVVLVTLWATLKSFLIRATDEDPGTRLQLEKHPRFRDVLIEVAKKIETRTVDNVYLTPGTELAVMERGGLAKQLRQASERCLILGVGVIDGMKLGPFRAVLAHEYGHFSNRDTAGGGFSLAVRRSLMTMAMNLAEGGAATWYSPAWLFLNGFYRIFLRISHGASRLQEVLADRWAAFAYGAGAFEAGLRHVIERSIRFDRHINVALKEVIEEKRPLSNLYLYTPDEPLDEEAISGETESAIHAEPSACASHPSPEERFAWVHELETGEWRSEADDQEEVWSLFSDRSEIEEAMTNGVRETIEQTHGIKISAEA